MTTWYGPRSGRSVPWGANRHWEGLTWRSGVVDDPVRPQSSASRNRSSTVSTSPAITPSGDGL